MVTAETIKARAQEIGFDLCGIAPAAALPELTRLREWLDSGYAGEMIYLHKSAETRADIRKFLPSARAVIVTGTVYYTDGGAHNATDAGDDRCSGGASAPPGAASAPPSGEIARYAWGEDY